MAEAYLRVTSNVKRRTTTKFNLLLMVWEVLNDWGAHAIP